MIATEWKRKPKNENYWQKEKTGGYLSHYALSERQNDVIIRVIGSSIIGNFTSSDFLFCWSTELKTAHSPQL